jgi:hypothetical protein
LYKITELDLGWIKVKKKIGLKGSFNGSVCNKANVNKSLKIFSYGLVVLKTIPFLLGVLFVLSLAIRFRQINNETAMFYMLVVLILSYFFIHKSAQRLYDAIKQKDGVANGR